jgi:Xaa-Pro dipeptidase
LRSHLSLAERDRRWAALMTAMRDNDFDALIFAGSDHRGHKGSLRYVADYNIYHRYGYAAMDQRREPALILPMIMAETPRSLWAADQRHTAQPAAGLVDWLSATPAGSRVGIVGLGQVMRAGDYLTLIAARPDLRFDDATALFEALRAIKSAEEVEGVREAALIADACFKALLDIARPGETERSLGARMLEICVRLGGEDPLFLTMKPEWRGGRWQSLISPPGDRTLSFGQAFTLSFEMIGPSGYWTEFARPIAFGRPGAALRDAIAVGCAATDAGCAALLPGEAIKGVQEAAAAAVDAARYELSGWSGHSIGQDVIELPFIGPPAAAGAAPAHLMADMTVAFHPLLVDRERGPLFYMADILVIGADGTEALSAWPRQLYTRIGA